MRVIIVTAGCLAIAVAMAAPAGAQGPIRQGLRATGEAVVEGAGAVARGAGAAARATGEAGRAVVGGTVDAGRAVVGGAARGVDALTPDLPAQARLGARLRGVDAARDARWRFAQHNGEWWYYSPENNWMYHRDGQWNQFAEDSFTPPAGAGMMDGQYSSGYRGVDQAGAIGADQYSGGQYGGGQYAQGPVYTLQYDAYGREFICDNGRRVYFDDQAGGQGQWDDQSQWGTPTPEIPREAGYRGEPGAAGGVAPGSEPATGVPSLPADSASPAAGGAATEGAATTGAATTGAATTGAAATGAATAGAGDDGVIEGDLPAEAPREINQDEVNPPTEGTIEPGDSAQ